LKKSPAVVLACGLQGVGKTTSLAKIAKRLKEREKKRVLLASTDIRRPAALAQLKILSADIGVNYAESDNMSDAVSRGKELMNIAHRQLTDVVLMDTAGRTTLDDDMMDEIRRLAESLKPAETLFFVDSMQGQDAVNTARRFHDTLPLTGIVLTKFDGDARGGAALSARAVIGAPVKFVGVGEKPDDLQDFHPARFASRILGMGDLASLAEQAAEKTDQSVIRRLGKKLKKPDHFDLNDQLAQMQQMKKMGGVDAMVDKMPGMIADKLRGVEADGDKMKHMEAIIYSMTPGERAAPEIIKASRKRRIAAGSGATVNLVNQLLTQHEQTRKIMKRFAKNPAGMMRMMQNLLG
jgi:signal recognition particle subunit SRP54